MSTNYIDVNTLSYAHGEKSRKSCGVFLNTDVNTVQSNIKSIICSTVKCTKDNNGENMTRNLVILCLIYVHTLYHISL